jgi:hypothetical protein
MPEIAHICAEPILVVLFLATKKVQFARRGKIN